MTKIYYIEDRKEDFDAFKQNILPSLQELDFFPEESSREEIIENIGFYLDPIGDSPDEMKNKAKLFLDEVLSDANGFIIDYELEGNSQTNVNGCRFYEEYILKNENLKNCNVLFLTRFKGRTSNALSDITYKIATEYNVHKVKLNSKHNFKSPTVNEEIIKNINDLFLSPNF